MTQSKTNPYPHNNFAPTEDYLEELILISSGERGRIAISQSDDGYQDLTVNDTAVKILTVPSEAIAASIHFETDETSSNKSRALRFKENGTNPTATSGQAFGDGDVLELLGKASLDNFKIIGIEAGKNHALRIQYYKSSQNIPS
jgi:hypothetical protein